MKKGQTATEYLIILAIIIVIALVVVGVMGGIPGIDIGIRGENLTWLEEISEEICELHGWEYSRYSYNGKYVNCISGLEKTSEGYTISGSGEQITLKVDWEAEKAKRNQTEVKNGNDEKNKPTVEKAG